MTDAILERSFDPPITSADVLDQVTRSANCLGLHRVDWIASYLALDGRRMVCHFSAPDLESTRIALRRDNVDTSRLWKADVHDAPGTGAADIATANVIVDRSFEAGVALEDIQKIEDAGARCLEIRNVRFLRTFFAADGRRMFCLYAAPDAESVRQAQREAGVPFDEAWSFCRSEPHSLVLPSG